MTPPAGDGRPSCFVRWVIMSSSSPLDLFWLIPGVLAGMSMPFIHPDRHEVPGAPRDAFADEVPLLWEAGVRAVVSLLNSPRVAETWKSAGFDFLQLPVRDGYTPTREQFQEFLRFMRARRAENHPVAVHCVAGIGRTGLFLASYDIMQGATPEEALLHVRSVRRGAVETRDQWRFLQQVAMDRDDGRLML